MERSIEPMQAAAKAGRLPTPQGEAKKPDLDLDRLIWDPEYREAMRPWLGRAG